MSTMIALYYCYPPKNLSDPSQHASFHQDSCTALNLGGRIRVSIEGINGVLSGRVDDLKEYESKLRGELAREACAVSRDHADSSIAISEGIQQTYEYLDIKYCHLRPDIPIKDQLFDSLHVKVTKEVVSLFDFSAPALNQEKKNKRCRQRRRQKRKEKKLNENSQNGCVNETADEVTLLESTEKRDTHCQDEKSSETAPCIEIGSAFTIQDWGQHAPAVHLSPTEWNDELLSFSQQASNHPQVGQQQEDELPEDAILLDARNIYETRIGHFAVPNLKTFFPNTRKFSSLPMALNTPEAAEALAGKKVFMYCTGGIRCERAGSYLRALSESNAGAWKDKVAPKGIYQLKGGIQRYLETYGEPCGGDESVDSVAINENTTGACLYRGKNFVFDHRRTDPVVGSGITKPILTIDARNQGRENAEKTERISLVGKCIICSTPHDDYDNGHAPCEGEEARCCRCRVLILVCNICRAKVRCWGDPTGKQELYCGNSGNACVDDGNIAENVETALF